MEMVDINSAKFTYLITDHIVSAFTNHYNFSGLKIIINYTKETEVLTAKTGNKELAIIGICIDSRAEIERKDIPQTLLSEKGTIDNIYSFCNRFAGKYVILYYDGIDGYLWGDATATIQVNYSNSIDLPLCVASTDKLAADTLHCQISERMKRIRLGASFSQALPWNVTMYEEISVLLPNHYLCISNRNTVRVPLAVTYLQDKEELSELVVQSDFIIKNIVREYSKYYKLVCPLTSGYDSRVVFSYLKDSNPKVQCYTFMHEGFTDRTGDLSVPLQISNFYKQPYTVIKDLNAPESDENIVSVLAGDYQDKDFIDIAYTYNSVFKNFTMINGDIIDQIGKSLLGNSIPNRLAKPSYFQCKLHNCEKETREIIRLQLDEMLNSDDREHLFDLFAMENRCGRWAAQNSMIYSACGITSLNIFNCRELLMKWISIPRKIRRQKWLHKELLSINDKQLLSFPFNPTEKFGFMKNNWVLFFISTYMKQYALAIKTRWKTKKKNNA